MDPQGEDFLSGILLDGEGDHVSGLDDLVIPLTPQDTQASPEVEVVASRGNKGSKRAKNFSVEEDEIVCEGWLVASKDPIHGANQNRTSFWGKVHAYFWEHNKGTTPRTESSLLHRWLSIQTAVNKFTSCLEAIERRNQSGTTIQDRIAAALKMFSGVEKMDGKKCSVVSCYNILKEEDKWKIKRKELLQLEKQAASGNKTKKSPPRWLGQGKRKEPTTGKLAMMMLHNQVQGLDQMGSRRLKKS
ncbi:glutathione S-transferase T3-like [Sorghum bicolor]|uniref:glutathione S-transferase T3-like n=1 Tax=Sorghum bicolor TaxID=4558 RepID=UPI000B4263FB|nr:glutathione S-transferase T3-like [Sorghum bicolor]XP_021318253.1 glutathione S-transferase T3-like [Sorghum bicolor]|eukprot:XP_021318252.1 glutathione S-transferase T3-like [Sorghum bicolor]